MTFQFKPWSQSSVRAGAGRVRAAVALAVSLWAVPCHAAPSDGVRGAPLTITPLLHWNAARVSSYLRDFGLDRSHVKYGVDAYRVVYRTISPTGTPTTASSLLAVPRSAPRALRLVAWLHGTTVYKGDAASVDDASDDRAAAFVFASAGYLTTAPDFLGLGEGPGTHPYNDRASEVSASLDALRATRTLAEWLRCRVEPGVAVSGFSQGGSTSLALARALQAGEDKRFELSALAPISGPYDMTGSLAAAVAGDIEHASAYLAYLTISWNRLHYLYASPSDAFLPPYDQTLETLFDNTHPDEEVFAGLPETLDALFNPSFLALLAAPSGALRNALAESDSVCDWQPNVTPHLYTSTGDRDVPVANTRVCQQALTAQGAAVEVTDFGEVDHAATVVLALPRVVEQFDASR